MLGYAIMRIRPLDASSDFPALATLLSVRDPEPPTPDLLQEWERNTPQGLIRQRLVAFDEVNEVNAGTLVGFCDAASWPWEAPTQFWISTIVAPQHREHGLRPRAWGDTAHSRGTRQRSRWPALC